MPSRPVAIISILAVIAVAGAGVYAALVWQGAQPVDDEKRDEFADQSLLTMDTLQRELEADIAAQPRSEVEDRLESPLGQALFRRCSEWTALYDSHPDEDVLGHRDEACGEYREYVEIGTIPEQVAGEAE